VKQEKRTSCALSLCTTTTCNNLVERTEIQSNIEASEALDVDVLQTLYPTLKRDEIVPNADPGERSLVDAKVRAGSHLPSQGIFRLTLLETAEELDLLVSGHCPAVGQWDLLRVGIWRDEHH